MLSTLLALAVPGAAWAAADWTITRIPSAMLAGSTATFSLVATNIGTGGKASAIGCIVISIPSQFNVNSAGVVNASGHVWTASVSNSGGPGHTVTVNASTAKQRLTANKVESITFTIDVTADTNAGIYQWTANAFIGHDCSGTFGQPAVLMVTIGALPVNRAPVAQPDSFSLPEDGSHAESVPGVLANDSDPDGDPITAQLTADSVHGSVRLAADGSFLYTPVANYNGADSFSYRISDGKAVSGSVAVSLTVTPVNDPPVAVGEGYAVDQGATLSISAPGVLSNDSDLDRDALVAQLVSGPAHGSLSLFSLGAFKYAPDPGFAGSDSFIYQASDGTATSAAVSVDLKVVPTTGGSTGTPDASATVTPTESASPDPGSSWAGSGSPPASDTPAPTPALTLARAAGGDGDSIAPIALDFAFAGMRFESIIPGLAIGVPGLLVIAAIGLQFLGALAWLPAVRRNLGSFGFSRRSRRSRPSS